MPDATRARAATYATSWSWTNVHRSRSSTSHWQSPNVSPARGLIPGSVSDRFSTGTLHKVRAPDPGEHTMKHRRSLALVLMIALGAAACGRDDETTDSGSATTAAGGETTAGGGGGDGGNDTAGLDEGGFGDL